MQSNSVRPASELPRAIPQGQPSWTLGELEGRFCEFSAPAATAPLSLAFDLLLEAQQRGEPLCWISAREDGFFAPDVAECGVDLAALPVIRCPDAAGAARAAERLLRSGAYGLVLLDLGPGAVLPLPLQSRLVGLAQKHLSAIVCLTEKDDESPSLGSLISLRCSSRRVRLGEGRFRCRLDVLKDKRRGPGWSHQEERRGPTGLR